MMMTVKAVIVRLIINFSMSSRPRGHKRVNRGRRRRRKRQEYLPVPGENLEAHYLVDIERLGAGLGCDHLVHELETGLEYVEVGDDEQLTEKYVLLHMPQL